MSDTIADVGVGVMVVVFVVVAVRRLGCCARSADANGDDADGDVA